MQSVSLLREVEREGGREGRKEGGRKGERNGDGEGNIHVILWFSAMQKHTGRKREHTAVIG